MAELTGTTVMILAGGLGTRLREITHNRCPKPMVPVPVGDGSVPFLEFILAHYRQAGVTDFIICIGHLGEQVIDHFGDGGRFGLTIRYDDAGAADTGQRVSNALALVAPAPFLVTCGDTFLGLDVAAFVRDFHAHREWQSQLAVIADPQTSAPNVAVDAKGLVLAHGQVNDSDARLGLETGTMAFRTSAFSDVGAGQDFSLTKHLFPDLVQRRTIGGVFVSADFFDIGTPAGYRRFCDYAASGQAQPLSRIVG